MKYHNFRNKEVTQNFYEHMLHVFVGRCQELVDDHMKQYHWDNKLTVTKGRRYDKIVCEDMYDESYRNSKRVWGFIDKTNGDILKPEGWKKPAKNARGNIYEDDCMQFVSFGGPAYMDTIKSYYGV